MTPSLLTNTPRATYSFAAHHRRFSHLTPADRLREFLALPEWQRLEAWAALRADVDRERGPPGGPARLDCGCRQPGGVQLLSNDYAPG